MAFSGAPLIIGCVTSFYKRALCEYKCNLGQEPVQKCFFQREKKKVKEEICSCLFLSVSALVDILAVEIYVD